MHDARMPGLLNVRAAARAVRGGGRGRGPAVRRAGWWLGASAAAVALLLALLAAGCGEREPAAPTEAEAEPGEAEPYVLAVSIHPLADLASQVAGPGFEVHTLLPPGVSPHGFEPTAEKVRLLARADLVLSVGLRLDPWVDRAAASAGGAAPVLAMADLLDRAAEQAKAGGSGDVHLNGGFGHDADDGHGDDEHAADEHGHEHERGHEHSAHDHAGPNHHLWLDPVLAQQWVRQLRRELVSRFPDRRDDVERNAAAVLASLEQLDAAYREQLAEVPKKELVTFHNAFDRLAQRYGLTVVAHLVDVELEHGAEVRPGQWRAAVQAVQTHNLKVLYSETQFPDRELASIRSETGVEVLVLDPLGHPRREGYQTYQEMMRSNLETLVDGQSRVR